mmetsp:Transcript_135326/g.270003  ORF Transcript_135326/g.270003 Transcript_135326/m.270003 type:complete len:1016 (-) Transcript_135326:220-3267(-)
MDSFYDFFSGLYPGNFAARGGLPAGAGAESFFGHPSGSMIQGMPYHFSAAPHPMDPLSRNRSDHGAHGAHVGFRPGMHNETAPSTPQARSRGTLETPSRASPSIHRRASADPPTHRGTPGGMRDFANTRSPRESLRAQRPEAQTEWWYGDPPTSASRGAAASTDAAHHDPDSRDVRASLDFERPGDRSARSLDVARRESKFDRAAGSPYASCRDIPSPGVRRDPGYGPEPVGSIDRLDGLADGASATVAVAAVDARQRRDQRNSPERLLHQGGHGAPVEPAASAPNRDQHGNDVMPQRSSSSSQQDPNRGQPVAPGGRIPVSSPSYERRNPSTGGHGPPAMAPSASPEPRHGSPRRCSPTASPMRRERQIDARQVDGSPIAGRTGWQNGPPGRGSPPPQRNSLPGAVPEYRADKEDLLDQHVAYYLRRHPQTRKRHTVARKRPGVYELDGREVNIEWQYASEPGQQGFLVVVDGPLRQPFSDYMEDTEANAEYEGQDIGTSSLHMIPKDRRISFNDTHKVYSRLEAMKVAKEQALVREKAANFTKEGKDVPQDIMQRYKKSIQQKLGLPRRPASPQRSPKARPTEPVAGFAAPSPPRDGAPEWQQAQPCPPPGGPAPPAAGGCSSACPAAPGPSAEVQQWNCTPPPPMAAVVGAAPPAGNPSWSPAGQLGTSQGQGAGCSASWSPPPIGLSGAASYSPPTTRNMPTAPSGGVSAAASYTPPPVSSTDALQRLPAQSSYSPPPVAQQHGASGNAPPGASGSTSCGAGGNLPTSMSGMGGRSNTGLGLAGLPGMASLGEGLGLPGMGALNGIGEGMSGGCMSNAGMSGGCPPMNMPARGNSGAAEVGNSGMSSGHNLLGGMPHAGSMGVSHMGTSPFSALTAGSSHSSAHTGAYSGCSASLATGGLGSGLGSLAAVPGNMGGPTGHAGVPYGGSSATVNVNMLGGVAQGAMPGTTRMSHHASGAFPCLAGAAPSWRTSTPMVRRQPAVSCLTAPSPPPTAHAPWSLYGAGAGQGCRP